MRDNSWLTNKLQQIHEQNFKDVKLANTILVRFGRIAKTRLGSISLKKHRAHTKKVSLITINGLLKNEEVPEYVVEAVLAHELVHYCHGFSSPLPRLYRYPHQAGIVDKELVKRGFKQVLEQERVWTKNEFAKLWLRSKER